MGGILHRCVLFVVGISVGAAWICAAADVRDISDALDDAQQLPDETSRGMALSRIAVVATLIDPQEALSLGDRIDDNRLRMSYRQTVVETWTVVDAASVLDWITTDEAAPFRTPLIWALLAAVDPERLLEIAAYLVGEQQLLAEEAALIAVARHDVRSAIDHVNRILAHEVVNVARADNALRSVGTGYAHWDAESAWQWASTLESEFNAALFGVLTVVVEMNVERAVEHLLADPTGQWVSAGLTMIFGPPPRDPRLAGRAADRLALAADPSARRLLTAALTSWASADPDSALFWALANVYRIDAAVVFAQIGMAAAALDPAYAATAEAYVPYVYRAGWTASAAMRVAGDNPAAAVALASRLHGGQPELAVVAAAIADSLRDAELRQQFLRYLQFQGLDGERLLNPEQAGAR